MPSLGELFIELGVVGDEEQIKKYDKKVKELAKDMDLTVKSAIKAKSGFKSLEDGIKIFKNVFKLASVKLAIDSINKLTNALISNNQAWVNVTRQTDLSLKSLQKYAGVASLLDKSLGMEGAAASIADLEQRLFNLKLTGEGAEGFLWAGIDPRGQDATGVLEQLRSRISGMNNEGATFLLNKMGLDPKLLPLLRMSKDEFDALGKTIEKYQLTQEQRESIAQMNVQLGIASQKLQYLKDGAVLALMPLLVKLTDSFARVVEGIARISKWLTTTKEGATALAVVITGILIPAVKLLFGVITSHPIIAAISAIITGLYLLIDDIVGYFQGKNSGIGYIINFLKDIGDKIEEKFKEIVQNFRDMLNEVINEWENFQKRISGGSNKEEIYIKRAKFVKEHPIIGNIIYTQKTADPNKSKEMDAKAVYQSMLPKTSMLNNTSTYDYRQLKQNISINTSQPAYDIQQQLAYTNFFNAAYAQ